MAHPEQKQFCEKVKQMFPQYFQHVDVLDIGSMDINGNNRYLFEGGTYTGIDLGPGPNVDIVCKAHEFKPGRQYDVVISTECLEHDKYWKETLQNAIDLLKPGGLLLITCATTGRAEHGTVRSGTAWAAPHAQQQFEDYYMNLTEEDIGKNVDFSELRYAWFETNRRSCDLYFVGIKRVTHKLNFI